MGVIDECVNLPYNWDADSVYLIEKDDYVDGGEDGTSNVQAKQLARRTRDLHTRTSAIEDSYHVGDLAALNSAKQYTDNREVIILGNVDTKDTSVLTTAKAYADTIVAALVDSSPEALNTLSELAQALGNDPNFATTVLNLIGQKANTAHVHAVADITNFPTSLPASDVSAWAKAAEKPIYSISEIGTAKYVSNTSGVIQRKVITAGGTSGYGYFSCVAIGQKHRNGFCDGVLSVANGDYGASYVDYLFKTDGNITQGNNVFLKAYSAGTVNSSGAYICSFGTQLSITTSAQSRVLTHNLGHSNYIVMITSNVESTIVNVDYSASGVVSKNNAFRVVCRDNTTNNAEFAEFSYVMLIF